LQYLNIGQRREDRMKIKKLVSAIAALVLGTGLAVGTGIAAASAHTVAVYGSDVCLPESGTYLLT